LIDGCYGIPTSDNGNGSSVLGSVGQHLGYGIGSQGKVAHFKDTPVI
jgi:hypothetical protein